MTGYFVPDECTVIESVLLCLIDSSEIDHSAVEYARKIRQEVIEKFELVKNNVTIICATTDNAANMIATARELKIKSMPCYAHTLQLVINDILFPPKKKTSLTEENVQNDIDEEFHNLYLYVRELFINYKFVVPFQI